MPREVDHDFSQERRPSRASALCKAASLRVRKGAATTEALYRKVIVPELRRGAEVMDQLIPASGHRRPMPILGGR
jgi:hypothetical protein